MKLGATFGFLSALSPEIHDWHYAGKDVKLNAPDMPIFWYRRNKSASYLSCSLRRLERQRSSVGTGAAITKARGDFEALTLGLATGSSHNCGDAGAQNLCWRTAQLLINAAA